MYVNKQKKEEYYGDISQTPPYCHQKVFRIKGCVKVGLERLQKDAKNNMKKIITFIILLCVIIIGFAILNNISFNKEMQSKKATDLSKDSLLYRQVEIQDLLLGKSSVLDSMNLDHKYSNSIIKVEIEKIRDNSDEILKFQKKIYQNNKK